jgi:ubiquinone/menaquinone biosynthesis C-methylase UbiE
VSVGKHRESVGDLFDRKAPGWAAKYRGTAVLAWRARLFPETLAKLVPAAGEVLDFGCGTGDIAHTLSLRGYTVSACDISKEMVRQCKTEFGNAIEWAVLDPNWSVLPFEDHRFVGAIASSVLEYVPDIDHVFREFARVLRHGAGLVVSVPDCTHLMRKVEWILALLARSAFTIPFADGHGRLASYLRYLRLSTNRFSESEWLRIASRQGFDHIETQRRGALMLLSLRLPGNIFSDSMNP